MEINPVLVIDRLVCEVVSETGPGGGEFTAGPGVEIGVPATAVDRTMPQPLIGETVGVIRADRNVARRSRRLNPFSFIISPLFVLSRENAPMQASGRFAAAECIAARWSEIVIGYPRSVALANRCWAMGDSCEARWAACVGRCPPGFRPEPRETRCHPGRVRSTAH